MMKLKELKISRNYYSWDNELKPLMGTISLISEPKSNSKSVLDIQLNDEEIQKILSVVSDAVVIAAARHAQLIRDEIAEVEAA